MAYFGFGNGIPGSPTISKVDPALLNSNGRVDRVVVVAQGSPQELSGKMKVAFTMGSTPAFIAFGTVPRAGLTALASLPQVQRVYPDVAINYNDSRADNTGGGQVQTDMFRVRDLIGVSAVNSTLHLQGDGVKVAIVDTGTDFANPNMADSFATDANGLPIALDPDGAGIVLTNTTLHSYTNASGVYLNMLQGGLGTRVSVYFGAATFPTTVLPLTWLLTDYKIGASALSYIVSKSGNYHFGIAFEWTPQGFYFFPMLVVDSRNSGIYDTVYVDFNSAPRLSELLLPQSLPGDSLSDWSFVDDTPHQVADGTQVLSASLSGGVADISAGLLGARVLDVFGTVTQGSSSLNFDLGALNGTLLAPMDPNGLYLGVMYDFAGHGSETAANVASSGVTPYNTYGNGTLYHLAGMAPHAKVIPVKALYIGDVLYAWMWTSGFDYAQSTGWTYSGNHKADIISNSWGVSAWPLFNSGLGYDVVSLLEDALSLPHSFSPGYPGTIFVQAMGNGGPGYGTITSPGSASFSIGVGASTSWHVAQQISSTGRHYYGGSSSYSGDVIAWSDRGPGLTGEVKPDVVNIGAFGFTPTNVMSARGNTSAEWSTFGGTSEATPLTAGVAALVVQALQSRGATVSPVIVKQILMGTAKDLGYDPFVQGAGQVNASAATSIALNGSPLLRTGFTVGTDQTYANLSNLLSGSMSQLTGLVGKQVSLPRGPLTSESWFGGDIRPGSSGETAFTMKNPTAQSLSVNVTSSTYKMIGSKLVTGVSVPGQSVYINLDRTAGPIPAGTDLMVVREYFPFNSWSNSTIDPYFADALTRLRLQVFNWVDSNNDGVVQYNEVSLINTNYGWANTEEARVSSPLAKFTGTPVLGVYQNPSLESYWFGVGNHTAPALPFSVMVYYYQKVPWKELELSGPSSSSSSQSLNLQVQAGSTATFGAKVSVPLNATAGTYEGFINLRSNSGQATQIPVSYVVPIDAQTKGVPYVFGGNSSGDGVLYSNGATYGATDFSWRYESGNWRAYQVAVTDPTVNQGTVRVQWSSPMTSINLLILDPLGRIVGSSVPPGLYKSLTRSGIQILPLASSPSNDYLQCPTSFGGFFVPCPGWAGGFAPSQNDGPNSSILEFPVNQTGTYTVVVHNTVYSGLSPFERFVGEVEFNTIAPISSPPTLRVSAPTVPVKGVVSLFVNATGQGLSSTTVTVDMNQPLVAHAGQGTFRIDTTTLADGPHLVVVTANDLVGHATIQTFQLVVLNTPPQVTVSYPVNGTTVNGQVNLAFSSSSPYLANMTASIDGSPVLANGTSYSWRSQSVADGLHQLKVIATDKAGNSRTVAVSFYTNNQAQSQQQARSSTLALIYEAGAGVAGLLIGVVATLLVTRRRREANPGHKFPGATA